MFEISGFFIVGLLMTVLGVGGYFYNSKVHSEAVFIEPVEVHGEYKGGRCGISSGINTNIPTLYINYEFRLANSTSTSKYIASDYRSFYSTNDCMAALEKFETERPTTKLWYEKKAPWKTKFSLKLPNSNQLLWIFLPFAGIFFWFAVKDQKSINRRRGQRKVKNNRRAN